MQVLDEWMQSWLGAAWSAPALAGARVLMIVVLAIVAQRLAARLLKLFRVRVTARLAGQADVRRVETVTRVIRYVATAVIVLISGMLVLSEIGISIAPILGAAGIVGLAVGFGAQSLVKDYFTGFFLLLENQIARGDVVRIADRSGQVEDITLRYVRLRDYHGDVHYVPNGLITSVTNLSREFSCAVMDIGVGYREDLGRVFTTILDTARTLQDDPEFGWRILEPLELAGVQNLADSAIIVRCRFKVRTLEQWAVRREFLRRLKTAFDACGIEIPYPQVTFHAAAGPPIAAIPPALQAR